MRKLPASLVGLVILGTAVPAHAQVGAIQFLGWIWAG